MTAKKAPLQSDVFTVFIENSALPETMAQHAGGLFKAQAELLDGYKEIARGWMEHRREDQESAVQAAERMYSCGNVNEVMIAYFDWLGGTIRRLTDNAAALSEKALAVTASAAKAGANGAVAVKVRSTTARAKSSQSKPKLKVKRISTGEVQVPTPAQPAAAARPMEQRHRLAS